MSKINKSIPPYKCLEEKPNDQKPAKKYQEIKQQYKSNILVNIRRK